MRVYTQTKNGKTHRVEQHGLCKTLTYRSWSCMRARCTDPTHKQYKDYGGRGIKVCEEWYNSFTTFLRDMGERPDIEHSIERIDNDKGYFKDNCKWVHRKEQYNNKRKPPSKILLTINGKTESITYWSKLTGVSVPDIWRRKIKYKLSDEECIKKARPYNRITCVLNGIEEPLSKICKRLNINYARMKNRIKSGDTIEEALTKEKIC